MRKLGCRRCWGCVDVDANHQKHTSITGSSLVPSDAIRAVVENSVFGRKLTCRKNLCVPELCVLHVEQNNLNVRSEDLREKNGERKYSSLGGMRLVEVVRDLISSTQCTRGSWRASNCKKQGLCWFSNCQRTPESSDQYHAIGVELLLTSASMRRRNICKDNAMSYM